MMPVRRTINKPAFRMTLMFILFLNSRLFLYLVTMFSENL